MKIELNERTVRLLNEYRKVYQEYTGLDTMFMPSDEGLIITALIINLYSMKNIINERKGDK